MKGLILSVLAAVLSVTLSNCSSTLQNTEQENSLYGVEAARGEAKQTGSYDDREEKLAKQEINDRDLTVDPKRGYPILVVNYSNDPVTITVKKASFWGNNPVTRTFHFYGKGAKDDFLMPGSYDVECSLGHIPQWRMVYEVTTAPQWDDNQKGYYSCVIPNVYVSNSQMNHGKYHHRRYHFYSHY
jgi:hypothetical protein